MLADMMDYLGFEGCKQDFQRGGGSFPGRITEGPKTQKHSGVRSFFGTTWASQCAQDMGAVLGNGVRSCKPFCTSSGTETLWYSQRAQGGFQACESEPRSCSEDTLWSLSVWSARKGYPGAKRGRNIKWIQEEKLMAEVSLQGSSNYSLTY